MTTTMTRGEAPLNHRDRLTVGIARHHLRATAPALHGSSR